MAFLTHFIARVRRSLAYRGWRRSLRLLGLGLGFRLRHGFGRPLPQAFDLEFGTDTGSPDSGGERKGAIAGVPYGPVDPVAFDHLLENVPLGAGEFTFLDFGCGRGRALLLASAYPFRCIWGVEYDRGLYASAQHNLAVWARRPRPRCCDLAVVWEDATTWEFPLAPSVFFLNEPFYAAVMERVAERIRASLRACPRSAYVIYCGDWHRSVWETPGDFEIHYTCGDDRLYRWRWE